METKNVKDTLLERVSIRRYEREAIPEEKMQFIFDAIRNTPTSYNGQQFSVIDISDQPLKEQLYELTNQKQLKTCNRLLIFCSDYNKISLLAQKKGLEVPAITDTMDGVVIGIIDASLAMMSAVVAAESVGLGTNCVGYLRTVDPAKVAELLKLPKGVFVVCGLAIGVPREHPDLKPKQPVEAVVFRNCYQQDEALLTEQLGAYDREVSEYNLHRAGGTSTNDWVAHILGYYDHATKYRILDYLKDQGYDVKR
ncbi:MAG: nitroreductase family protein [Muribaculaceae bacterium]|nr:nitroreductase family protein [Muribaculaceae bacterium]